MLGEIEEGVRMVREGGPEQRENAGRRGDEMWEEGKERCSAAASDSQEARRASLMPSKVM